ncbi:MAG: glycosyltransferase family 2 protein [Eubacteriales bacterium]|nr:glycosyltransferase family 2 protein [Eubacteriales bacterium]
MNVEISVIVPVYNVEKYLEKCIKSILCQTYKNFELILVDDASPDRCPSICDEYAKTDERITVIHRKKRGGLSAARNTGIDSAKGRWLSFVDSDDWIAKDMLEELHKGVLKHHAQVAICDFFRVYENGEETGESYGNFHGGVYSYQEVLYKFAGEENIWYTIAWGKLYDRRLFDTVRYPVNKLNEDIFVALELFKQCERICSIEKKMYYYVSRAGSIMQTYTVQSLDGVEGWYHIFQQFYREKKMDLLPGIEKLLFAKLTTVYGGLPKKDRKEARVKEMIDCSKEAVNILKKEKLMSKSSGIRTALFYHMPTVYFGVEKIYNVVKRIRK